MCFTRGGCGNSLLWQGEALLRGLDSSRGGGRAREAVCGSGEREKVMHCELMGDHDLGNE